MIIEDFARADIAPNQRDNTFDSFLDWKDVSEMSENAISFGSHTMHHHLLTKIPLDLADQEISISKKTIEENTEFSPQIFCYPSGTYSSQLAKSVEKAGYLAAFTTEKGYVSYSTDHYTLPRMNIHEDATCSMPLFMMRILGIF